MKTQASKVDFSSDKTNFYINVFETAVYAFACLLVLLFTTLRRKIAIEQNETWKSSDGSTNSSRGAAKITSVMGRISPEEKLSQNVHRTHN